MRAAEREARRVSRLRTPRGSRMPRSGVAGCGEISLQCHPDQAKRVEGPPWRLRCGSLDSLRLLGMTRPSSALRAPSPRTRGEGELLVLPLAPRERGEGGRRPGEGPLARLAQGGTELTPNDRLFPPRTRR